MKPVRVHSEIASARANSCCARFVRRHLKTGLIAGLFLVSAASGLSVHAQSTATLQGNVMDPDDGVVPEARISVRSWATNSERIALSDTNGNYQLAALPVGAYRVEIQAMGFQTQIIERLGVEVGRTVVQDFKLEVANISEEVSVLSPSPQLVDRATVSVGQVIDQKTVQEIPLNGRYFLDLGLLIPGSVTPPQTGVSSIPVRGSGAFAINTAGNREEAVNYMINGITLTNLWFSSISFQPSISTIQELRIDNSTFSAEYGQNSGAVVNIATRSGTNELHGELFEFFRNDALDARNFFDFTSSKPPPFKRNQFGGNLGGPIVRNKAFFLFSYEGLRHRQGISLNSVVLNDTERASVKDPAVAKLIEWIPRPNFVDSSGTPRFLSSPTAPVNLDHWTIDISHNVSEKDQLHAYYYAQLRNFIEPGRGGNTVPGFGVTHRSRRQLFTLNETHTFGPAVVNEARFGFNRIFGADTPTVQVNPADFGILNGINEPIGLPQITIAGGLSFGGPANNPSGRGDTMFVAADTVRCLCGRHSIKAGGEYRQFLNNIFRKGTGAFNFPTIGAFVDGTANSFSVTLGNQSSSVAQSAVGFFVQDNYKRTPNLTLEVGLRYDWSMMPTERYNRFIIFDPTTGSLARVGTQIDGIYQTHNKTLQPRVGFAWDPFHSGKTSVRAAYAILADQPLVSLVTSTSPNPPLAMPLTVTGSIRFGNAITEARPAGLAPQTVDHGFNNAYLQSWNLNVERELAHDLAAMVGYFGSKGTHLTLRRNINQPINGVRPYPALSGASAILPGTETVLGNVVQAESTGNSNYNALWANAKKQFAHGLSFNVSYTWSKSLDYNSLSSQGVVQNSYNVRGDRGLSDFDVRHRVVGSALYELPFHSNQFVEGWQLGAIVQSQSGNPVNIVTTNSTVTGLANTLRPDVAGPIRLIGNSDRWFDTSIFKPVPGFGTLGRNVVIGPGFSNTDLSVMKNTRLGETMRAQFRVEIFDLFNHANFGQPGNVVDTPAFGRITNTRFPTGESGSSRQVQFALKVIF